MNLEELCALGLDEDAAGRVLALHGRALEDQRDRYEAQAAALQGEDVYKRQGRGCAGRWQSRPRRASSRPAKYSPPSGSAAG